MALMYLPRGPFLPNSDDEDSTISLLHASLPFPIVRPRYRFSQQYQFPTPVHDIYASYDWIQQNLLTTRKFPDSNSAESAGCVAVFGELLGGSLATMLGLNECRQGEGGVVATVINDPILDWVSLDHLMLDDDRALTSLGRNRINISQLLSLRAQLFRKPEHYFDPFASPLLFFRSAGVNVPPPALAVAATTSEEESIVDLEDDMQVLIMHEREEALREDSAARSTSQESQQMPSMALRKSSKLFPSKSAGLLIPPFRISAAANSPLIGQAEELHRLLTQSFVRDRISKGRRRLLLDKSFKASNPRQYERFKEEFSAIGAAAERHHVLHIDIGHASSWNSTAAGRMRVLDAIKWLRDRLT